MKCKVVLVAVLFVVIGAAVSIMCAVILGCIFGLIALMCFVLFGGMLVILNEKLLPDWFRSEEPSSFFQDLSWRNVDKLVLGSTQVWNNLERRKGQRRVYPLPVFRCSLRSQFDVLQCYFGHLKKGGTVLYFIDIKEALRLGDSVSPLDVHFVHRLVYMDSGGKPSSEALRFPLLSFPVFSLSFAFSKMLNMVKRRDSAGRLRVQLSEKEACNKDIAEHILMVDRFCKIRRLSPRFYIIGDCDINLLCETLGSEVLLEKCTSINQLNDFVWGRSDRC